MLYVHYLHVIVLFLVSLNDMCLIKTSWWQWHAKVTPEVIGNNDVNFKQAWAHAFTEAEGILSSCIEQHLERYIEKIDSYISARVN